MDNPFVISSLGLLTPVGPNYLETCLGIKAGAAAFADCEFLSCLPADPEWDDDLPMMLASVPTIAQSISGAERLIHLAVPPLLEMLEQAKLKRQDLNQTGFLLALSDQPLKGVMDDILVHICRKTGLTSLNLLDIKRLGRCGVLQNILQAQHLIASGQIRQCIIGGVDSYLFEDRLTQLDRQWRLKSERNLDGFIPGEAGTMLMLETLANAKARGARPLAQINTIATGREAHHFYSEKNSTGQGLTSAIREAVTHGNVHQKINQIYCDFNGESYYAFELGLIMSRLNGIFGDSVNICHPADSCGDLGSAAGGLLLALAMHDFHSNNNADKIALLWNTNDSGARTALVIEPLSIY
jgi:3-oxoacyl-[acyl-carrier-protein] synthase I